MVIAILAAITVMSYRGIQQRAQDTAVTVEAKGIDQKVTLASYDNANDGYGYGGSLANKQAVLDRYGINEFADRIAICQVASTGGDGEQCEDTSGSSYKPDKIYVHADHSQFGYSYWSYAKGLWVTTWKGSYSDTPESFEGMFPLFQPPT